MACWPPGLLASTIAAQLVSLAFGHTDTERRFAEVALPSIAFLSIVTLPLAGPGIGLGRKLGLGTPLIDALLSREPGALARLRRDTPLAAVLGLLLGIGLLGVRAFTASSLPPELPALDHRGVIGGLAVSVGAAIAEEVWFRLGPMTLLVGCIARLAGHRKARPVVAWPVILITAVAFGLAHLPQLVSYGAGSPFAIGGHDPRERPGGHPLRLALLEAEPDRGHGRSPVGRSGTARAAGPDRVRRGTTAIRRAPSRDRAGWHRDRRLPTRPPPVDDVVAAA